jgi:PAS domain S-box-containing protein
VEAAEAASQRGERFQAEYRVVRKDGRVIWVSDTAVVVEGSGAHPLMEGIIVDITERKQLETQLQQRGAWRRSAAWQGELRTISIIC